MQTIKIFSFSLYHFESLLNIILNPSIQVYMPNVINPCIGPQPAMLYCIIHHCSDRIALMVLYLQQKKQALTYLLSLSIACVSSNGTNVLLRYVHLKQV